MATLLIHTGGTIGMAQTPDGFAPRDGVVEDAVAALVASGKVTGEVDVLRLDPLIDSALATAQDWARIDAFFTRYAWAKRLLYALRLSPTVVRFDGVERAPA